MPLDDLHPRAPAAARASEAAAAQGRFWEMHDRLFEHQLELSDADLRAPRRGASASTSSASSATWATQGTRPGSTTDLSSGAGSGVPSTPRFFVNGVIHLGSASLAELGEAIEAQLQLAGFRPA